MLYAKYNSASGNPLGGSFFAQERDVDVHTHVRLIDSFSQESGGYTTVNFLFTNPTHYTEVTIHVPFEAFVELFQKALIAQEILDLTVKGIQKLEAEYKPVS